MRGRDSSGAYGLGLGLRTLEWRWRMEDRGDRDREGMDERDLGTEEEEEAT